MKILFEEQINDWIFESMRNGQLAKNDISMGNLLDSIVHMEEAISKLRAASRLAKSNLKLRERLIPEEK